jgi:hypothetical protein
MAQKNAKAKKKKSSSAGSQSKNGSSKPKGSNAKGKKANAKGRAGSGKRSTKSKASTRRKSDQPTAVARRGAQDVAEEAPASVTANLALAGKAATSGTRAAGTAISLAASRARVPLIAGSAAVAGMAGGLAVLRRRQGARRNGGFDLNSLLSAARHAGEYGEEVGQLAALIQRAIDKR